MQPKSEQDHLDGKANSIMLITYLVAGCICPLLGGAIDRVGKRGFLMVASACSLVLVHVLLRNTSMYPVFPLILLGLTYVVTATACLLLVAIALFSWLGPWGYSPQQCH